jgi:hypothetical protein
MIFSEHHFLFLLRKSFLHQVITTHNRMKVIDNVRKMNEQEWECVVNLLIEWSDLQGSISQLDWNIFLSYFTQLFYYSSSIQFCVYFFISLNFGEKPDSRSLTSCHEYCTAYLCTKWKLETRSTKSELSTNTGMVLYSYNWIWKLYYPLLLWQATLTVQM